MRQPSEDPLQNVSGGADMRETASDDSAGTTENTQKNTEEKSWFSKAFEEASDIGGATWRGALAGAIIFGVLARFNMRVAFYGAVAGAVIGAGREIYNTVKENRQPGPPPEP